MALGSEAESPSHALTPLTPGMRHAPEGPSCTLPASPLQLQKSGTHLQKGAPSEQHPQSSERGRAEDLKHKACRRAKASGLQLSRNRKIGLWCFTTCNYFSSTSCQGPARGPEITATPRSINLSSLTDVSLRDDARKRFRQKIKHFGVPSTIMAATPKL